MPQSLTHRIAGPVLTAGDPGYQEEMSGFNLAYTHSPEVVVGACGADDVVETLSFARQRGLKVRIQATGHGVHEPIVGGLLITTRRMSEVSVDPVASVATVGAGVHWSAVIEAAAAHGLTPITGSSVHVGVIGYLLGGGLGPLARSHGFGSDYLESLTLVTGTGEVLEASASLNSDLFWALRGGKAGLGVVTEAKVRLVRLEHLYAGSLYFEEENIASALGAWIEWTRKAPALVSTSVALIHYPPFEAVPAPLRGRRLLTLRFAFPGPLEKGERFAAPLRALAPVYLDTLGPMAPRDMGKIHNDPELASSFWVSGMLLESVDQDFASSLLGLLEPGGMPIVVAELRHLGEAATRDVEGGSAVGGRPQAFAAAFVWAPEVDRFESEYPTANERLREALAPWISPYTNINFAARIRSAEHYASAWPEAIRSRLMEIRAKHDPDHLFA